MFPMNFEDTAFLERIRSGDPEAIAAVVNAYLPQLLNAARGVGLPASSAEDVVQTTFATFIEKASTFEGRSHVRTWLFGILYRKIAEARRGLDRNRRADDIDEVVHKRFAGDGTWQSPPQQIALFGAELRLMIDSCLESLPTIQRFAFILREVEEMPREEICKILEVTRTNLGVLLYRGRNRLRECLESKGVNKT